jgi:hypothetical protein
MRACLTLLVLYFVFAITGCSKSDTAQAPAAPPPPATPGSVQKSSNAIDVCSLLTSTEIEAIQGGPLKDTKPSTNSQGGLTVSQCYFLLPTAVDSIVVTVTQRADGSNSRDPKQSWDEIFRGDKDEKGEAKEEEGKSEPPEKIEGLGDEAFWAPRRFGGALYALKGNVYISVSVGGAGDKASKIQKSKALAEIVLKRL